MLNIAELSEELGPAGLIEFDYFSNSKTAVVTCVVEIGNLLARHSNIKVQVFMENTKKVILCSLIINRMPTFIVSVMII